MTNEEAIKDIKENIKPFVGGKSLDMAIEALKAEPTKHGRWKHHQYGNTAGYYECDNCGKINSYESNYCPKCGADMRGGENDNNTECE